MKKLLIVASILVGGCIPAQDIDRRLEVTDEIRSSCPGWTDQELGTMISVIESDRLGGATYTSTITTVTEGCYSYECVICWVAAVDQLYGMP